LSFCSNINTAVDCFRPLIKKLSVRKDIDFDKTVLLSEIPELDFLGLVNWSIALIRENVPHSQLCGRLVTRYRKQQNLFQSFIFLNEPLFYDTEPARMKRKIVFIHEFTHFAACIYTMYTTNKDIFINSLEHKFNDAIDEIFNPDVSALYHLLKEEVSKEDDIFKHIQHTHFKIGPEKIRLSYTDLYLDLLFSEGTFEEFFDIDNQKEFYQLWKSNKRSEAVELYRNLVKEAAKTKWVPEKFALDQAQRWMLNYIQNPLI
jgi:hypothetical protein